MQKRIRRRMKFQIAGSGSRGIFLKKTIILGIEGTAWNFSAAVVDQDDVIAVLKRIFKRDPSLPDISQYSVPKPKPIIIPG